MTSRQTGQLISGLSQRRGKYQRSTSSVSAARRKPEPLSAREKRRLTQLVICGLTFVALVAIKLLLPAQMARLSSAVSNFMDQSIDVTSVFSAVGRAISGDESVQQAADEVYQEVFHPMGKAVETAAGTWGDLNVPDPMTNLQRFFPPLSASDQPSTDRASPTATGIENAVAQTLAAVETAATQKAAAQQTAQLSYILYSNQNLPDNVSLEQAVLGFDYCTPVSGTLSSDFGYREHPIEGEEKFHYGVDLAADSGTEIDCFADGTVKAVGESSSYGKYVIVSHADGYSTLYAHCSAVTVSSGASVKKGQKIAEVGETGLATGPHLHFELHSGDTYLDPIYYVTPI